MKYGLPSRAGMPTAGASICARKEPQLLPRSKVQQFPVVALATEILRQFLGDDMAAATNLATYVYDNLGHKLKILAVNC